MSHAEVSTRVRGIIERDSRVVSPCTHIPFFPLVAASGQASNLVDVDGNTYLDFLSAAGILNVGHNHPRVREAIKSQADQMVHYNSAYVYHERMIELAEELVALTPGSFEKQVAFGLSGADANDGAVKVARAFTGRSKVIVFQRSYHGNTYGALSMSTVSLDMRRGFAPGVPEIYYTTYPDPYRDPEGSDRCLLQLRALLETTVPAEEVAAVVVEPIQGDAGIIVPPASFIRGLRALCDEIGALLVSEEVQTGFGRTGRWFAIEHFDVEPDLMVLGKSIASGMPLSAIVGRADVMDAWRSPAHVFSTGANPVCCAAALATIQVIRDESLVERSRERGAHLERELGMLATRHELIGDVRGVGLMLGVDLVRDRETKERATSEAAKVVWRCFERNVYMTFFSKSVLRLAPPLVIKPTEIDTFVSVLDATLTDVAEGRVPDSVLEHVVGW